jgi:hypothetical protein
VLARCLKRSSPLARRLSGAAGFWQCRLTSAWLRNRVNSEMHYCPFSARESKLERPTHPQGRRMPLPTTRMRSAPLFSATVRHVPSIVPRGHPRTSFRADRQAIHREPKRQRGSEFCRTRRPSSLADAAPPRLLAGATEGAARGSRGVDRGSRCPLNG